MSTKIIRLGSRSGFTLPEVLVAVAMVGVLAAVVMPTVVGQVSKGEVSRVVQDLQGVEQAAATFRADVGKWPGKVKDLVYKPLDTDGDPTGAAYGATGVANWKGPYLARGSLPQDGTTSAYVLPTALGRIVRFEDRTWAGSTFFTVETDSLTAAEAALVSLSIDGEELVTLTDDTHGKIRWVAAGASPSVLYYFASPLK